MALIVLWIIRDEMNQSSQVTDISKTIIGGACLKSTLVSNNYKYIHSRGLVSFKNRIVRENINKYDETKL